MPHAHSPTATPPSGELVLDRYRLLRRLGSGGMGVVYLARDERLERDVAVKRIGLDGPAGEAGGDGSPAGAFSRAQREAIASARLSHPGIVALFEAGRDDDAVYLVSELVRGRTLAELMRAGALSDRDVLRIGAALCDALAHAHQRGVIHRDVKPANVLCPEAPAEGGGVAKLADLGIARLAGADALTRTGDVVGTLAYMAPEQAAGRALSGAADAYALGIVLYEALAGFHPVRADNAAATARRVGMRIAPLSRARRDLPRGLCRTIDAMVVADPRARPPLTELRGALAAALPAVGDEPAIIAGSPTEGLLEPYAAEFATATRWRQRVVDRREARRGDEQRRDAGPQRGGATVGHSLPATSPLPRGDRRVRAPRAEQPVPGAPRAESPALRAPFGIGGRLLAAAAAAALTAAALGALGPEPPIAAAAGATLAGLAVALLPRLGWLTTATLLGAWLAGTLPGIALLLAAAVVPVVVLLPRAGWAWSLPATAAALGAATLAGAWPALAGQAARWPVRAALGALGMWWLLLAELASGERLLLGIAGVAAPRPGWEGSATAAAQDALWPVLSSGVLAAAALWGLAAALLPVLVRGRSVLLDLVGMAFWAAALAAGTQAIAEALSGPEPRGLVVAVIAAGAIAVGARALRGRV